MPMSVSPGGILTVGGCRGLEAAERPNSSSVLYRSVKLEQKRTMEKPGDKNKMKHVVDSGVMTRSKARSSDLMLLEIQGLVLVCFFTTEVI
ncbi:unnamed protein product [Linum tenue]|uniref:Uncharacterized protein n=1 Tax=Linum tenue TaxID=586396 RepID=A0AAV0PUS2_9ROSI|nr:unnamed protein product [Linum tenue]